MKVSIDVGDFSAELGTKGIILHIWDNAGKKKKVVGSGFGKSTVEWLPGEDEHARKTIPLRGLFRRFSTSCL